MSQADVPPAAPTEAVPAIEPRRPRMWLPVLMIGLYWLVQVILQSLEMPFFFRFLSSMAGPALLLLVFTVWWWRHRAASLFERFVGYVLILGGAFAAAPLTHPSIGIAQTLMLGVPVLITVWMVWILWAQRAGISRRWIGSLTLVLLAWGSFALIRIEGVDGDLHANFHWRWSPTAEELFLADTQAKRTVETKHIDQPRIEVRSGDWPEFRGLNRAGKLAGVSIRTDWTEHPPKLLWQQRIGPAWSSVIIIGDRLFTQEQRGEKEAVVCYAAATGKELWAHEDVARFWESVSGAGPRATPTFANGRIYSLGATGILNCLDAATGDKQWSHNLQTDASATVPAWGLSSSPLVVDGICVVYGGGENHNNLLAYDANSGKSLWTAAAGVCSYASPHLVTIEDQPQVLMLNDHGLMSVEPTKGQALWTAGLAMPGAPRNLQPHLIGERQLLVGTLAGFGLAVCEIGRTNNTWTATEKWASTQMKAEFSEMAVHQGHAYGFDGAVFCCIDIATGERRWKGGRYGRGQVILLEEQHLLLVLSETGEAVLVSAQPGRHEEFGRFQAITGKTWNHPVVAHGRLFARNAEEIACYQLDDSTLP